MQNFEGFWEHRILVYVTLLDSYVSQRFGKAATPSFAPKKKLARLKVALAKIQPPLGTSQELAVLDATSQIFSATDPFAGKFQALMDSLDADVVKIIHLTKKDFDTVRKLRNEIAHGQQPSFKGPDFTLIFDIANRITLLLTYVFFLDIGLKRDVFLRCLDWPHNELRRQAKIDDVHLARICHPEIFLQVSSQELAVIRQRPRGHHCPCFDRDARGVISFSLPRTMVLSNALRANGGGRFSEALGLPEVALTHHPKAYFEDGVQIELVYSLIIAELSKIPSESNR